MSNTHISESSLPASQLSQDPKITEVFAGRLLLLRRRKTCKTCNRVHGPPQENCKTQAPLSDNAPDDSHLPWIF